METTLFLCDNQIKTATIPTIIIARYTSLFFRFGSLYNSPPNVTDTTFENCLSTETTETIAVRLCQCSKHESICNNEHHWKNINKPTFPVAFFDQHFLFFYTNNKEEDPQKYSGEQHKPKLHLVGGYVLHYKLILNGRCCMQKASNNKANDCGYSFFSCKSFPVSICIEFSLLELLQDFSACQVSTDFSKLYLIEMKFLLVFEK